MESTGGLKSTCGLFSNQNVKMLYRGGYTEVQEGKPVAKGTELVTGQAGIQLRQPEIKPTDVTIV